MQYQYLYNKIDTQFQTPNTRFAGVCVFMCICAIKINYVIHDSN